MHTQPPVPPGSPDVPPPQAELEAVRAALAPDYDVLQELGRGGMAIVYRAREVALDREVAIKVLPASLGIDRDFVERFEREARTAGGLEHPNIVPIYRVGRAGPDGRIIYFVMKMLRGQSLSAVLRGRGRLASDEIRRIMKETASALGFAAKKGVVHRDIKPDNILLDDEGRCVVTDFGIAKTSTGPHTAAGTSMGTPRYMSPEHAQGTPVDVRSDIYSLGVVAYQCLAGVTPFDADNPFAILYKHINETLPRPTLSTPDEWALWAVIEKCLGKKPEQRYQSADELLVALGAESVASNTLTAAVPMRISSMVKTEVITTTLRTPWYTPRALRDRLEELAAKWHMKPWQLAVGTFGVVAFAAAAIATLADSATTPPTDSVRLAGTGATSQTTPLQQTAGIPAVVGATTGATTSAIAARDAAAGKAPAGKAPAAKAPVTKAAPTKVAATPPQPRRRPDLESNCPAAGTKALTKMANNPAVLINPITDKTQGDTLHVGYDVCGLRGAFNTQIVLRKIRQSRFRRAVGASQRPLTEEFPDASSTLRLRRWQSFDLAQVSGGTYEVSVIVVDRQERRFEAKREFEIKDK